MDKLLKALNGYTARIEDHSPMILIGNDTKSNWTRAYGLAPPTKLMNIIETVSAKAQPDESEPDQHQAHQPAQSRQEPSPAQKYFSDVELINQYGEKLRFYSDLLKGKVCSHQLLFSAHAQASARP